jgi:HNH endonuclease
MTYAESLKTYHWKAFRDDFIQSRQKPDGDILCDDCGYETIGPLHVHHKVYKKGAWPWEYEFDDLRLICKNCHAVIHETEDRCREFVRTLPPHVCDEFENLLMALSILDAKSMKVFLARMKHETLQLRR